MQIDLHGVKHENVVKTMDTFIWECMQTNTSQATVITGNSFIMKQMVVSCLAEHGLTPNDFFYNIGGSISFDL